MQKEKYLVFGSKKRILTSIVCKGEPIQLNLVVSPLDILLIVVRMRDPLK